MVESVDGKKSFSWSHSYSKIYHQNGKYEPQGVFTNFQNYKVEERDRVKCVSASEGKYSFLNGIYSLYFKIPTELS